MRKQAYYKRVGREITEDMDWLACRIASFGMFLLFLGLSIISLIIGYNEKNWEFIQAGLYLLFASSSACIIAPILGYFMYSKVKYIRTDEN